MISSKSGFVAEAKYKCFFPRPQVANCQDEKILCSLF